MMNLDFDAPSDDDIPPLEGVWRQFAAMVIPEGAPDSLRRKLRQAFFIGAMSVHHVMKCDQDAPAEEIQARCECLADMADEIEEFLADLQRGAASRN